MELSHSLTLNEEALAQIPPAKRPVFIFEWLRFLDKVLVAAQKNDIKGCQKKLVEQLMNHIQESPGPPTRKLIARSLATLFSVGDTFLLFDTVNKCNDILKNKDDSPSFLPTRLAAICCVGTMYEKLGRMMGRSYEETVQILTRSLRSAESQTRIEIMLTLEKVCAGMGNAISNVHKDIYKAARHCLIDRVMAVRCAATRCLLEMLNHAPFLYTSELESLATLCFRAFDGSNYEVRCAVAKLLGALIAMTQNQKPEKTPHLKGLKLVSLDEALGILMAGFLRGGVGFLKGTGEIIKGSSSVNREVRVGVTHAYVIFVQILGSVWLERNIKAFLSHILYLVANPKAASSHVDAVYSRKCINFILRSVLGKMLGEKAQTSACKEIAQIIVKEMNSIDFNPENAKDFNQETLFSQHLLVCALQEIGCLVLSLGTTAHDLITDPTLNLIDATASVLIHPCQAARLAAAWCLRCICVAVPSQITPLIDRCVNGIEEYRTSPEAIAGYSGALAAVLGGVNLSPLGVPHTKGKVIFNTAEELLRSASQNSRLSLNRTQAGWLLIGAIMTLGVPVVRGLLPRMLLLWRNSFPRSTKELDSEKARGDAFTWQVTLEGRAGALSAMHSFLQHCHELVTDDINRRLLAPIESALAMLSNISSILKSYGQQLKAPAAMVRLRLYETLILLPPQSFESSYTHLLRMLVAEFTLTENPANTTTSQMRTVCHADDSVILGTWLQETDHRTIEDQMEPNRRADGEHLQPNSAAGSGALEHDPCCLYRQISTVSHKHCNLAYMFLFVLFSQSEIIPGPLPLGVAVIDMSVLLFGQIFPRVANKHRLQMVDHFAECIKHAKSSRQEAVQMNVFTALLSGLKGLTEAKMSIGQEDVKKAVTGLIIGALTSPNPILRCAAGEAVGRMAQVVSDPKFTAELAQTSFDRLKSARDVASRTGHSLALGCLHRYVGGMGSSQHLNTSVSILLALAQDQTSPVVQVWSLHALALIADSGGPMFRGYVEPSLSLALKLLLNVPQSYIDVHQCIGKVLSALITTIGPELQGNTSSICMARSSFLCACAIMQDHQDPLVQAEATGCLQQLHLFAPRHVNLSSLVPTLCRTLSSNHLLLRKAAISCLRQLAQREAKEVCEHAMTLANESRDNNTVEGLVITETGLPGVFFSMLDTETDAALIKDIHDTLISMLQMLAADNLSQWLGLCKDVLTIATDSTNMEDQQSVSATDGDENDEPEADDDQAEFHAEDDSSTHPAVQPRWPTRVFAAECVRKIITACESSSNKSIHFDLIQAKEMGKSDFLVLHLSELIRMAFIAATSDSDPLRLEGLKTLQDIIEKFSKVPEPEFPGHLLLEQFQAQVGAALRPAFAPDTSSHVTAAACEVCSTWIGSNVARDLNDLRRVHQLLVSSLTKLQNKTNTTQLYNESLATLEKLAILKAWAEVYIVAMKGNESANLELITPVNANDDEFGDFEYKGENLLTLVQPELVSLSQHWLAALKDHALLSLPAEFASQLPHDGGAFYTNDTMESSRPHYMSSWPPILHAAALWLNSGGFDKLTEIDNDNTNNNTVDSSSDKFHLLFGICMEALCSPRSIEPLESIITCLKALYTLLDSTYARELILVDNSLGIELCNVLHRLILTRDNHTCQLLCMEVLKQVIKAAQEKLDREKKNKLNEQDTTTDIDLLGEGGECGDILPGKSLVFSVLEVCLCLLVRQLPSLSPSPNSTIVNSLRIMQTPDESGRLIASSLACMENLHKLCSPQGALSILPTVLYLTTGVIKEMATKNINDVTVLANNASVQAALHCLKILTTDRYCNDPRSCDTWQKLLQSALAKIIDLAKTGSDENKLDEVTMMLAIAVFVLHAPSKVVTAPNLQYPCINHFRQCLQSSNSTVRLKCVQTLKSLFAHPDRKVATPYIHTLAPRLVEFLYSDVARNIFSDGELFVTLETIVTVESLIELAEPQNRDIMQGIQMLTLLVPILISYLLEGQALRSANKYSLNLHEISLQRLMKIGPKYPQEFKKLMSQTSELRTKLENAIRSKQQNHIKIKNGVNANKPVTSHHPSIKLKTDFSNFS
ncbi:HEAT repeat-containing protein 5B isoform X4 [Tribolium madens]|nr:HEAT repeat-containing protein 5B isoform X4 [Tribolium madens]